MNPDTFGTGGEMTLPARTPFHRWLLLTRVLWLAIVLLIAGILVAAAPARFALLSTVCIGEPHECAPEQLTTDEAGTLAAVGLSLGAHAAYNILLDSSITLVALVIGLLIFWRKSADRRALLVALLPILGGATFAALPEALEGVGGALGPIINAVILLDAEPFLIFLYIFPDGRFVPRWTRWLTVVATAPILGAVFFPGTFLDPSATWPAVVGALFFFGLLFSGVVAQVLRYRRVSSPVQRVQTKWVVFGTAVAIVGFATVVAVLGLLFRGAEGQSSTPGELLVELVGLTGVYGFLCLIPLSIGVAILRSGLYDIDVLINRALVYSALTVALAGTYLGSLVLLQQGVQALTGQGDSPVAVVASTLAIAALFQPLRGRIQRGIDRRFYRRKYDAARTLQVYSAHLRDEVDLDRLTGELLAVVGETVQPTHASVWLRPVASRTTQGENR
ncbi:MAG: hypothetical protein H0V86_12980 [Chloroflexia bacterium]|nr:hypothetical protein [Chloroflexia bacterium]